MPNDNNATNESRRYCIECKDRVVVSYGAHFCKLCASTFYGVPNNDLNTSNNDEEGVK